MPRNLIEVESDEYQRVLQVNTHSGREILRSYLPGMKKRRFGRIVAISSSYALIARDGRSTYSISKAALEALVRSVAIENASFNILANSIIPGFIETPLTLKNNNEGQIQKILERIPVGRLGTPNEIATLVNHLISESNSYITGQSIQIDGGFSIN
jgi:NAD(P)-dependent dehydrogenase (short-subunit alcohol dehydrogenase family)